MSPETLDVTSFEGFTVGAIAARLGLSTRDLWRIADSVESRYRFGEQFRDGKSREIAAPDRLLKRVQRLVERELRARMRPSSAVFSIRGRGGAIAGAKRHFTATYLSTRDLLNAFPSMSCARVQEALVRVRLPDESVALIRRLVTVRGSLPQGAPTSNAMLDLILGPIDDAIQLHCEAHEVVYTRYADDMAFSSRQPLDGQVTHIESIVERVGLRFNREKSRDAGPGQVKIVNGVKVGPVFSVSDDFRFELERALDQAEQGHWLLNRAQIEGRIDWLRNFEAEEATRASARLNAIRNRGGRRPRDKRRVAFRPRKSADSPHDDLISHRACLGPR